MIAALRSLWIWGSTTFFVLAWVPLTALVYLLDRDPLRRRTARFFRLLGPLVARANPAWRLHISGLDHIDPNGTYVLVSNHQSLADIPLIAHLGHDAKWLAKAELFRVPLFGWLMRMAGDIPVERTDRRRAAQSLLKCAGCLRQKCSVMFFPEGTRSRDGRVLPFNDGPFRLAIRERVPVAPIVVEGTGHALPRNSWLFRDVQDIYLRVLAPVAPDEWQDSEALGAAVRQQIIEEIERIRIGKT